MLTGHGLYLRWEHRRSIRVQHFVRRPLGLRHTCHRIQRRRVCVDHRNDNIFRPPDVVAVRLSAIDGAIRPQLLLGQRASGV